MSTAGPDPDGTLAARARVETLFRTFDRLTPDELARIGCRPAPDEEREALLAEVDDAAARSGRTALVERARAWVEESLLRRYADGMLHPTWCALTWGVSQGTVSDRVAIMTTLADAAAVAVVEDVLDPEVASSLARDAADLLGLAAGRVSEWSLANALYRPAASDLGPSRRGRRAWLALFVVVTSLAGGVGLPVLLVVGLVELVKSATIGRRPVAAPRG